MSIPFRFLFVLLVCGISVLAPRSARAADCVAKPGPYLAVWERNVASLVNEAGTQSVSRSTISANIRLKVDCDGTVTVINLPSENAAVFDFSTYTRTGGTGKPVDGRAANAIVPMHYTIAGKATKGKNDFPVITLHVANDAVCPKGVSPPMFCLSATNETWTWTPNYSNDTATSEIISNSIAFNSQSAANSLNGIDKQTVWGITHSTSAYPSMANQPGTHSGARDSFSLARSKASMDITVSQEIETVFLDNVASAGVADSPAIMQTFRAYVPSWGPPGVTGKSMHFTFENRTPIDVPVSKFEGGNLGKAQFDVSNLNPGDHLVTVVATNSNNQTVTGTLMLTIIPTPPWARKLAGFAGRGPTQCGVSDCYGYSGTKTIPANKITFGIDIPDIVPIVGGPWGVKNLGFSITPKPRTLVLPAPLDDQGDVDGSGTFGLGDKVFNIAPIKSASHVITNTTKSALLFKTGYVSFDETIHTFTKHVGLTSAVASLASLTGIKGIGQAINSMDVAGVDATVGIGLSNSQIEFGAAPADQDIKITKFSTQLNLGVQMVANINVQVVGVQAVAQVNGALNLSFTPSPSITNCKISYNAYARVGVPLLGPNSFNWIPDPPEWHDLTQCKASNTAYEAPIERLTRALAAANRGSLFATAQAATPQAGAPAVGAAPAQAFAIHLPAGRAQTTLVANAPLTAAPAIAAGPGGRKALVWIANGAQLRLFDGKSWQAPVALGDGKHPDALPSVAFDGDGNIVVAWSVNETPNVTATTAIETQLASMQIETVTCDGHTGAVTSRKILSAGAGPHANVQTVAAADGSVWVAWQNLAAADYGAPDAPDRIFAAHWNKAAWSAPEAVVADVRGLQAWQLAAHDGTNAIVGYDATLAGKRTVHAVERSGNTWRETFSKAAAVRPATHVATGYADTGKALLLWADGAAVLRETGGAASPFIANAGGDPVLTAPGSTLLRTPAGYSAAAADPASGKAAAPVQVAPLTPAIIAPNAARDGNDWVVVSAPVEMTAKSGPVLLFAKK